MNVEYNTHMAAAASADETEDFWRNARKQAPRIVDKKILTMLRKRTGLTTRIQTRRANHFIKGFVRSWVPFV